MAEQSVHDVVNQTLSMGDSPVDVPGHNHISITSGEGQAVPEEAGADLNHVAEINFENSQSREHDKSESHNDLAAQDQISKVITNGDTTSHTGSEEAGYQDVLGLDAGAGSDTDISKADSLEQRREGAGQYERANSVVKKPTAFKPVSVTKNFLAKSGTGLLSTTKAAGDKSLAGGLGGSMLVQPARPRLVAKAGRDARAATGPRSGGDGGPDASKVWNRNRAAPPAPQKQFTDEELKQQYGIHLATRLQADEAGKESKWADIDDDEEDWAPETVEWMDGTKSTLLPTENQPMLRAESRGFTTVRGNDQPSQSPSTANQRPSSILGPGRTILKPGAARNVGTQIKPGVVLKNPPESPMPDNKPTPTNSSKSPWAALPPVDKASPISFNPPAQPSSNIPTDTVQGESRGGDAIGPLSSSTQEIDVDDFHRIRREGERGTRELFNAQSGRYEPAKNQRRSSVRQEAGFRPPAVLQRPPQLSLAEPSAAFQTSRASAVQEESAWNQRRGSLNGDNLTGQRERSASVEFSHHSPTEVRTAPDSSAQIAPSETPRPNTAAVPDGLQTYHVPDKTGQPSTGVSDADLRAEQQKLMRDRIERNRKRKQEEEAREEAERRERIRLKLEALGPPAPATKEAVSADSLKIEDGVDAESGAKPTSKSPTQTSNVDDDIEISHGAVQLTAETTDALSNLPLEHAPAQDFLEHPSSTPINAKQPHLTTSKPSSPPVETPSEHVSENTVKALTPQENQRAAELRQLPDRNPQSWQPLPPAMDPAAGWTIGITAHHASSGNVWGPPTKDRTLGNGAFEGEFQRIPAIQLPPQHSIQRLGPSPAPLAVPSTSPRVPQDNSNMLHIHAPLFDSSRADLSSEGQPGVPANTSSAAQFSRPPSNPPPEHFLYQHPPDPYAAKRAWSNLPAQLLRDDVEARARLQREHTARLAEEARTGIRQDQLPVYKETFRQTIPGDVLGQRHVVAVSRVDHNTDLDNLPSSAPLSPRIIHPQGPSAPWYANNNGRASRFFGPGADRNLMTNPYYTLNQRIVAPEPASPPPPESFDHPAFDGNVKQPHVAMPPPVPKVNLPPVTAIPASPQQALNVPMRNTSHRSGAQPIVTSMAWQDRFNGLLRPHKLPVSSPVSSSVPVQTAPSISGSQAVAINSASKAPLDMFSVQSAATVSIPQSNSGAKPVELHTALLDDAVESKPAIEELMDEREFGSSPIINLPKGSYENARVTQKLPHRRYGPRTAPAEYHTYFTSTALTVPIDLLDSFQKTDSSFSIVIKIPGRSAITKVLPQKPVTPASLHQYKAHKPHKKKTLRNQSQSSGNQVSQQSQPSTEPEKIALNFKQDNQHDKGVKPQPASSKDNHLKSSRNPRRKEALKSSSNAQHPGNPQLPQGTQSSQISANGMSAKEAFSQPTPAGPPLVSPPVTNKYGWAKPRHGKTGNAFNYRT